MHHYPLLRSVLGPYSHRFHFFQLDTYLEARGAFHVTVRGG